jgi:hypothetical protein
MQKDYTLFGQQIMNFKTKEVGLVLYTWDNIFADGKIPFATCVDRKGKKYNIELDCIEPLEV